jgi:hypothetical protein
MVSTNGTFNYSGASDFTVLALETGKRLHFDLRYTAADHTLVTTVSHNGQPYGTVNPVKVADSFADFRVDALAVMSYSDEGQDPTYGGSVLAHGNLDNLEVALPPAPVRDVQPGATASDGVEFLSLAGWTYTLAGSKDLAQWAPVSEPTPGTGDRMTLSPTVPPTGTVFYRIEARRP